CLQALLQARQTEKRVMSALFSGRTAKVASTGVQGCVTGRLGLAPLQNAECQPGRAALAGNGSGDGLDGECRQSSRESNPPLGPPFKLLARWAACPVGSSVERGSFALGQDRARAVA